MSNSAFPSVKFIRDENVKLGLEKFLKKQGFDIISKPKGISDNKLAEFSKSEQRVLITNDGDFSELAKEEIFSVIWLRISQDKPGILLESFSVLLKDKSKSEDFKGKLFILKENGNFKSFPLPAKKKSALTE